MRIVYLKFLYLLQLQHELYDFNHSAVLSIKEYDNDNANDDSNNLDSNEKLNYNRDSY